MLLESKEEIFLAYSFKIFVLEAVFHGKFEHFTVDATAFEIKFTLFCTNMFKEISHEKQVHNSYVFHLHSENSIDTSNKTLRIFLQMIQIFWEWAN